MEDVPDGPVARAAAEWGLGDWCGVETVLWCGVVWVCKQNNVLLWCCCESFSLFFSSLCLFFLPVEIA